MSIPIDKDYPLLYTLDMNMDGKSFYSLPVRKRHLLERKENMLFEKHLPLWDKLRQLRDELESLENELGIRHNKRVEKSCTECPPRHNNAPIYNLDKIHYLDGDHSNKLHSNRAIVCPRCESHIVLSAFTPKDIWGLKMKGIGNAEIGRWLGISRERVRKLSKRYQPEPVQANNIDIDRLVKEAQRRQKGLKARGLLKKSTDKRTLRKRIITELTKLEKKQER